MTNELDDRTYEQVQQFSTTGNTLMDAQRYDLALEKFVAAYDLLPPPREKWEAAEWLCASIGDCYFSLSMFTEAEQWLLRAMQTVEGQSNPFINLRMGESLFEMGETNRAKGYLLRAYMMEGAEIFEEEDPKYLGFLKSEGLI